MEGIPLLPSSCSAPTSCQDPPKPNLISKIHGGSSVVVNENLKRMEQFETFFAKVANEDLEHNEGNPFKGYPDEEKKFFKQFTAKKSEILYDLCKEASKPKTTMQKNGSKCITLPTPSKLTMKENCITPVLLNPAEQHDFDMKTVDDKRKPQVVSDVMGKEGPSKPISPPTGPTSSLRTSSWSTTQEQKRCLDGEKRRPKLGKRASMRKAADKDSLFEMDLLYQKYPKTPAMISAPNDHVDADIHSKKKLQESYNHGNGCADAFSGRFSKIYAREQQKEILGRHQLETGEQLKQRSHLQNKSLETGILSGAAASRSHSSSSNYSKPDFEKIVNATNTVAYNLASNDSSQSNGSSGAMKTKLYSSYSSSCTASATTLNSPPIGWLCTPPYILARMTNIETLKQIMAVAAKKGVGQGSFESNSSRHVNSFPNMGHPQDRTEQITKEKKRPRKLQQVIREDNESDLSSSFIPHFTMNFLNNVGPSQNSPSAFGTMRMPPSPAWILNPEQPISDPKFYKQK